MRGYVMQVKSVKRTACVLSWMDVDHVQGYWLETGGTFRRRDSLKCRPVIAPSRVHASWTSRMC